MGRPEDGAIAADFTDAAEQTMDEATPIEPWPVDACARPGPRKSSGGCSATDSGCTGLESTPLTSSTAVVNRAGFTGDSILSKYRVSR